MLLLPCYRRSCHRTALRAIFDGTRIAEIPALAVLIQINLLNNQSCAVARCVLNRSPLPCDPTTQGSLPRMLFIVRGKVSQSLVVCRPVVGRVSCRASRPKAMRSNQRVLSIERPPRRRSRQAPLALKETRRSMQAPSAVSSSYDRPPVIHIFCFFHFDVLMKRKNIKGNIHMGELDNKFAKAN
jgi:hypothetical protein